MKLYIKSRAAFATIAAHDLLNYSVAVDALDPEGSTATVIGELPRAFAGSWAIIDGTLFLIDTITPQDGRSVVTLASPLDVFDRKILFSAPEQGITIGGFLSAAITSGWIEQEDGVYAIPYASVADSSSAPFVPPDMGDDMLWSLPGYARAMRREFGVTISFKIAGNTMLIVIADVVPDVHAVVFNDGHSQLDSAAYSRKGVAKVTVIQNGTPTDWYLSDSGEISTEIPARRAEGSWSVISVKTTDIQRDKAAAAFAKNSESHKIEFWSDRAFRAGDKINVRLYGEILSSVISYVGRRSTDSRIYYRSGELATTAVEKLKKII